MRITNESYMIGYQGESYSRNIEYTIDDYLKDCQIYIEFEKPNGEKFTTKQIEDIDSGIYPIPYELLNEIGNLDVQLIAIRTSDNFILKSMIKTFYISQSINASDELIEKESGWNIIGDLYDKLYSRGVALELDEKSGIIKLIGKDKDNNNIVLSSIDLPTEKIIKNIYYDSATSELVFQFENANDVRVPLNINVDFSNYYTILEIDKKLENYYTKEYIDNVFGLYPQYFVIDEANDIITMYGEYRIQEIDVENYSYFRDGIDVRGRGISYNYSHQEDNYSIERSTTIDISGIEHHHMNNDEANHEWKQTNFYLDMDGLYLYQSYEDWNIQNIYTTEILADWDRICLGMSDEYDKSSNIEINPDGIGINTTGGFYWNGSIVATEDDIANLQAQLDSLPVFSKTVESNAYSVVVPNKTLDYALIEKVGGMSYTSENLIELEDVEETTTNGITYSCKNGVIRIKGTNTNTTSTTFITLVFPTPLVLNGVYSNNWFMEVLSSDINYIRYQGGDDLVFASNTNQTNVTLNVTIIYITVPVQASKSVDIVAKPMLVKGSTAPTEFKQGFEGIRNSAVTSITFNQKNLLPIVPRVLYDGTNSAGVYCTLDEEGWYTLTKTKTDNGLVINFMTSSTNIPAGVYSFRVVFKDLYGGNVGYNIGSFVGVYNVENNTENRAFTVTFDSNKTGYSLPNANFTYPLKMIYVYISASILIETPVTFKVQLVKNSFFDSRVEIPSAVQSLEGYGLGIDEEYYNYIWYNEEDDKYYFRRNVASYTFTGTEPFSQATTINQKYRWNYNSLSNVIARPNNNDIKGIIKTEFLETLTLNNIFVENNGVSINTSGNISWYIDTIQTLEDFRTYITGKTIIYKLATPVDIDISQYMTDGYIEVQEGGTTTFENEHKQDVPNTITYALKVV